MKNSQDFDKAAGRAFCEQRNRFGFSRGVVSKIIGISQHQLYKYEHGTNRITLSRAQALCRVYDIDLSWFIYKLEKAQSGCEDESMEITGTAKI